MATMAVTSAAIEGADEHHNDEGWDSGDRPFDEDDDDTPERNIDITQCELISAM
jgi:hypothetical protein